MKNIAYSLFILVFMMLFHQTVSAQKSDPLIQNYSFANGQIISSENGTLQSAYTVSDRATDPLMIGVWVHVDFVPNSDGSPQLLPKSDVLVADGIVEVLFNSENGRIKKGDPVTSSSKPGEAMKATDTGIILGIALEDADENSGLITIRVMIQFMK